MKEWLSNLLMLLSIEGSTSATKQDRICLTQFLGSIRSGWALGVEKGVGSG